MDDLPDHFSGLPIRPPTPPKELGSDDVVPSIEKPFESIRLQPEALYTPTESPASATKCTLKSSVKPTKHVGFSPLSPNLGSSGYLSFTGPLRNIPPSRECASRKSILKPCDAHLSDPSIFELKGAAEMLESLCRGLASPTKSARLDAYMTLLGCLKTYQDIPERNLLESKVSLLSDFIKRDISTDVEDIVDTQIRIQSLKLLNVFLAEPSLSNLLPHDFQCHVVDRAVKVLEEHTASKAIINLHMIILATQSFRSSIITEAKALDIFAALEDLTDHVKGNGIVGLRQRIYQRLLRQSKPAMIKCVNVWTSHLFSAMLSASKETRLQALSFGREASTIFGTQNRVSNSVQDIFNRKSPAGKKFLSTVTKRLAEMISNDEEKTDVPPIWGIVVMFLRSRPHQLEHWEYIKDWMVIIQKCFNSSSSMVKHNAALAWNRLVCAVDLSTSTSPGMIRTLKQPIKAQLERSALQRTSQRTKQIAYSSYCTLLYYAFRSQRPANQISLFWEEFVQGLLLDSDHLLDKIDSEYIFQVLTYLFDSGQPWNEKRAAEEPPVRPKDLPSLPVSWVHENASRILSVFQNVILSAKWEAAKGEDPWFVKAWNSFMSAIGQASGKEIKISTETMNAVAGTMNCLRRYWMMDTGDQVTRLQRISVLWKLANANKIHSLAFTECRLTGSCRGNMTAAVTPSTPSEQDRSSPNKDSATAFLMKLLSSETIHENSKETLATVFEDILGIVVSTSTSRQNTLKVVKDITSDLSARVDFWEPDCILWQSVVESLEKFVDGTKKYNANGQSSRPPASDYQEIIDVLELGLRLDFKPARSWQYSIARLAESISQEVGNAGLATAFIEPFACKLQQFWHAKSSDSPERTHNILECTVALMRNVAWPTSQKDMQDASLLVWGVASKRPMPLSLDPYITLYQLLATGLAKGFQHGRQLVANGHSKLLEVTISLLRSTPASHSAKVLKAIQPRVALWISDEFHPKTLQSEGTLALWRACAEIVESLPAFDTTTAILLEPLFTSALTTRHAAILEDALKLWQTTFGLNPDLIVPASVSEALACIQERREHEAAESAKGQLDAEMDVEKTVSDCPSVTKNGNGAPEEDISISTTIDGSNLYEKSTRQEQEQKQRTRRPAAPIRHTTPKSSPRRRRSRHTPPKRLRHEDSQIVFAAIHSSPYDTESLVSQFLTPHQREVRERQQSEANAMFPDIRSDPVLKTARKERKAPTISTTSMDSEYKELEDGSSPMLPIKEPVINDFVQSSPTPGPSRHASSSCLPEDGPPSSPPAKPTNRLAVFDQQEELMAEENRTEGITNRAITIQEAIIQEVTNQEIIMADAADPLVGEDHDIEPSFPGCGTRDLHESEAMNQDDDTEPSLPELATQRTRIRGDKLKKEVATRPSAFDAPSTENPIAEDLHIQADSKKSATPEAQGSELRNTVPNRSSCRTQDLTNPLLGDNPASDMDVYVDAPSSLPSSPAKGRGRVVHEQVHRNRDGQWVMVTSSMHHGGDAVSDVQDSTGSVQAQKDRVSRIIENDPSSSDVDEQVSQQIAADLERALTQVDQARREDSSSDALNRPSAKRKTLATSSPERPTRKSPRRTNVKVVIKNSFGPSQESAQEEPAADDDGLFDCIVVATSPLRDPPKKKSRGTQKARRESARSTPKSRKRVSEAPSTSKRRCSTRLSQVSNQGGNSYPDKSDEVESHGKASPYPDIAAAGETREEPDAEGTSRSSSPAQEEESVADREGVIHPENPDTDLASSTGMPESAGKMRASASHPPTSPTSSFLNDTLTSETSGETQTVGNSLLLRMQALVEEAKHVVLDHRQRHALLSTWMDLGRELHHSDAASRAAE